MIDYCPNCETHKVTHTYKKLYNHSSHPIIDDINGSKIYYKECLNCEYPSLWLESNDKIQKIIYPIRPIGKPLSEIIPENVRKTFDEARLVRKFSPRASCALLRICLEEILIEASSSLHDSEICEKVKNATNASRKIEILKADKNAKFKLDENIWDFAFSIKELGNDNSHAIQKIPDSEANETFQSLCLFIEEIARNLIYKLDLKQRLQVTMQNITNKS